MLPSLFIYQQFGPFIIRVVLGVTLAYFGYQKTLGKGTSSGSNSPTYGVVEIIVAVFLIVGLFTQLAALLNAVILIIKIGFKARNKQLFSNGINYYILLFAMALSLLVTGPGVFAFDLPL